MLVQSYFFITNRINKGNQINWICTRLFANICENLLRIKSIIQFFICIIFNVRFNQNETI